TWLGVAGPGVRRGGVDTQTWSDEADVRPTLLALVGLKDSYASDGRVLFEVVEDGVLPAGVVDQRDLLVALGRDFKRVNAPVGELGLATLNPATAALEGASEAGLAEVDAALDALATRRAGLASRMVTALQAAAFSGQPLDPAQVAGMQQEAQALLATARTLSPVK